MKVYMRVQPGKAAEAKKYATLLRRRVGDAAWTRVDVDAAIIARLNAYASDVFMIRLDLPPGERARGQRVIAAAVTTRIVK